MPTRSHEWQEVGTHAEWAELHGAKSGVLEGRMSELLGRAAVAGEQLSPRLDSRPGDSVVAAAILDRLLDRAAVINIKGASWRLREHQALTQPLSQLNDPPEKPPRRRG